MYVYGVMRTDTRLRLPEEGVGGRAVALVEHGQLAALVSDDVEAPVRASRRNMLAHSSVLQAVVAQADVLPMRFGVVMPHAAAVRDELLAAHADELGAELVACAGCVELAVTVTCHQDAQLRAVLASDPSLLRRPAEHDIEARIAFGERVARAVEAERERTAEALVERAKPTMIDAVIEAPRHDDMLANVAFLVERGRVAAFEEVLESPGAGRTVRCVGPLPPYHFVDLGLAMEEAEAWA